MVFLEKIMVRDLLLLIVIGLAEHQPNIESVSVCS